MPKYIKICIALIFLLYIVFGFFMLDVPSVYSDELWKTSRAYYLKTHHHLGEPLLPKEVSPMFAAVGNFGWKSWFIGTLKSGSAALTMTIVLVNALYALRLNTFLWSVLGCIATFFLARKLGLTKWFAFLSVAWLIAIPDFFSQVYRERPEIMFCVAYAIWLLFFKKASDSKNMRNKKIWLFIIGFSSWLPALLIHPSAIMIPATLGLLYLISNWKNLFSLNTIIIGTGLAIGLIFFYNILNSMTEYVVASGGMNYIEKNAPPILVNGWRFLLHLPSLFYKKFYVFNFLSRPLSFLLFASAIIILLVAIKKIRQPVFYSQLYFLIACSVAPLVILMLFSKSFGNFNVVAAPLIAISLSGAMLFFFENKNLKAGRIIFKIAFVILLLTFSSNAFRMKINYDFTQQYKNFTSEVRAAIPSDASVLGIALYYEKFKDQKYYSNSWFYPYTGKPEQSFEQALKALRVNYLIIDDALVSRAFQNRGKQWTDSMLTYLNTHAKIIKQIHVNYNFVNDHPNPDGFPAPWEYGNLAKDYIKQIYIYKIES